MQLSPDETVEFQIPKADEIAFEVNGYNFHNNGCITYAYTDGSFGREADWMWTVKDGKISQHIFDGVGSGYTRLLYSGAFQVAYEAWLAKIIVE